VLSATNHNDGPRILGSGVLTTVSQPPYAVIEFGCAGAQRGGGSVAAIAPVSEGRGDRKPARARALHVSRGPTNDKRRVSRSSGACATSAREVPRRSLTVVNGSVNGSRRVGSERVRRVDTAALVLADPGSARGTWRYGGDSVHVAHNPEVTEVPARAASGARSIVPSAAAQPSWDVFSHGSEHDVAEQQPPEHDEVAMRSLQLPFEAEVDVVDAIDQWRTVPVDEDDYR